MRSFYLNRLCPHRQNSCCSCSGCVLFLSCIQMREKSGWESALSGSILILDELLGRYGLAEEALYIVLMRLCFGSVKERIPGKYA